MIHNILRYEFCSTVYANPRPPTWEEQEEESSPLWNNLNYSRNEGVPFIFTLHQNFSDTFHREGLCESVSHFLPPLSQTVVFTQDQKKHHFLWEKYCDSISCSSFAVAGAAMRTDAAVMGQCRTDVTHGTRLSWGSSQRCLSCYADGRLTMNEWYGHKLSRGVQIDRVLIK